VGVGFTALEDVVYGMGNPVSAFIRILFFAMHMLFGQLMGTHLGLAAFCKKQGRGAGRHVFFALFLPVLWHTLFDAATIANPALSTSEENTQIAGAIVGIAVCAVSIVLQFVLLIRFRKQTEELCGMRLIEQEDGGADEDAAENIETE